MVEGVQRRGVIANGISSLCRQWGEDLGPDELWSDYNDLEL